MVVVEGWNARAQSAMASGGGKAGGGGVSTYHAAPATGVPFDCCALSLQPFRDPCCNPADGTVYDLSNAVPFVRAHGVDPVSGAPLRVKELVRLTYARNAGGELCCPVLGEAFTQHTKIAAIRTTGNVFSYKAVEELNLRAKNLRDLLSDEKFTRADVITLRDPLAARPAPDTFYHVRKKLGSGAGGAQQKGATVHAGGMSADVKAALGALGTDEAAAAAAAGGGGARQRAALAAAAKLAASGERPAAIPLDIGTIGGAKETRRAAERAARKRAAEGRDAVDGDDDSIVIAGQRVRARNALGGNAPGTAEHAAALAAQRGEDVIVVGGGSGGGGPNRPQPVLLDHLDKRGAKASKAARLEEMNVPEGYELKRRSTGAAGACFTSSAAPIAGGQELVLVRKVETPKEKGYVRLHTSHGDLNVELHCDLVPRTCENFLGLCRKGYYDGVGFHRSIRNFMIQGGDPTGSGRGGESMWGKPFKDEFDNRLAHDARGVLSMANSGPHTNKSQFFVLYRQARHLDNKHSVFGRVVGGLDVLNALEAVPTGEGDRPTQPVTIEKVTIFVDPYQKIKEEEEARTRASADAQREQAEQAHRTQIDLDDGQSWLGVPKVSAPAQRGSGVGKYLPAAAAAAGRGAGAGGSFAPPQKKSKQSGGYGNFSNF